ncbi:hypothetical protein [uncultured Methanomethylovorans sp.]|uniref:hypothetical protein n=1 Tax=uncultured Methanomethylovorans sp. TaxID=183759 RepID=UPI002AA6C83C|nr:hypothetical protein [uncultured Methanomethylovorans sp.]
MVKIFKKKESKRELTEGQQQALAKSSYELGFEVGYHKHSEIGWVKERFNSLYEFASQGDIGNSVKVNYEAGKSEGSRARDRDMNAGLSRKGLEKENLSPSSSSVLLPQSYNGSGIDNAFRKRETFQGGSPAPLDRPQLTDLPENTSLTKAVERPSMLDGFKRLSPKK